MVSYHHLQYQKKNNEQILRKPSDGRKDKRTDGQTDESDFIGRCRTNVELPISIWTKWERNNFRDQHQHHCSGAERLGAVIGREASEKITLVRELILGTSYSKSFHILLSCILSQDIQLTSVDSSTNSLYFTYNIESRTFMQPIK